MRKHLRTQSLTGLLREKKISQYYTLLLCGVIFILSYFVLNKEEKWILIPQYETAHRVVVTSDGYSEEYINDLVGISLKSLLSVNPNTVEREVKLFSEFSGGTSDLNAFLKKHIQYVKQNNLTAAFYPKSYTHQEGNVIVDGEMLHRFGSKQYVTQNKVFKVSYTVGQKGLLLINSIEEIKNE